MSNVDIDPIKKLGLIGVKKYWRRVSHIEMKLDWLYDWILVLTTFIKDSRKVYNNKEVSQNISVKQAIDSEWVSSFFIQLYRSI